MVREKHHPPRLWHAFSTHTLVRKNKHQKDVLFNESWVLLLAFLDQVILLQQFLEGDVAALEDVVNDGCRLVPESPVHLVW